MTATIERPAPILHGDWTFEPWIFPEAIDARVAQIAEYLGTLYAGENIRLITVLNGGKPFADLLHEKLEALPTGPHSIDTDTIQVKSYDGTQQRELRWLKRPDVEPHELVHDILVEDIIDSGRTLTLVEQQLLDGRKQPASLMTVTLLNRPAARASGITFEPQITGFEITNPDAWAIGFGLDLDQEYRNEPYIYGKVINSELPPPYALPEFPSEASWLTRVA